MNRPSKDAVLMQVAETFAQLSTCQRGQVGVVIAVRGRIVATGYNGAPAGIEHCDHHCTCGLGEVWSTHLEDHAAVCPMHPERTCTNAVHGEANAISFAAYHGIALAGAELITTFSPCLRCAQLIINSGIVRVLSGQQYHDPEGMRLLVRAGVQLT